MRRTLFIILVVVCLVGVGVLGYFIFNSKSIASIELDGTMQTLYVVGDDLDFGDAKLKVTYKNGTIKMVDLSSKYVTGFSTKTERADKQMGTMTIAYKSASPISINYTVIASGMYYVSSVSEISGTQTSTTQTQVTEYSPTTTSLMFEILQGGAIRYYHLSSNVWYLNDGTYDKDYRYKIVGDSLNIYLGGDEIDYSLVASYDANGVRTITSKHLTVSDYDSEIVTAKVVNTYTYASTIENYQIKSISLDLSRARTYQYANSGSVNNGVYYVQYYVGDTIKINNLNNKVYLVVTYSDPRVYYYDSSSGKNVYALQTVYVELADSMIVSGTFSTTGRLGSPTSAIIYYDNYSEPVYLYYEVAIR